MVNFLLTWALATISLVITAYIVPGITVSSFTGAAIASLVIGFLNATVRPILVILTLPLTILTLGLFLLVVNGISLSLASYLTPSFLSVNGFWPAVIGAIVLSIISSLLGGFAQDLKN